MMKTIVMTLALSTALAACADDARSASETITSSADVTATVLLGGQIRTMDKARPVADALAFDPNGRIISVGREADVLAASGEAPYIVDLRGMLAVPGFQDVHQHPLEAGVNENRCLLSEAADYETYADEIEDCREAQASKPWFYAAGVSMPDLLDLKRRPVDFLDEMFPHKPALIMDNIGHGAWGNSLALKAAGFDTLKGNPQGGLIDRGADGRPSGIVFENAQQALRDAALPPTAENLEENYQGLLRALPLLAEVGITSVSDAGGYWTRGHHHAWLRAQDEGKLTVRASNALYVYPDRSREQQIRDITALMHDDPDARLRFDQVKIYVDGILSQGTAALYAPYTEDPSVVIAPKTGFE